MPFPRRGFDESEFRARLARAQAAMAAEGVSALLISTEAELRYFSGFLTRFWESPTRPWFLVVPGAGDPVAVIPTIGVPLMARGWICDIRSWRAPQPGDDGISLLLSTLCELVPAGGRIAMPSGPGTQMRLPLEDFRMLEQGLAAEGRGLGGDGGLVSGLRLIKSEAEIDKIAQACAIGCWSFDRVGEFAEEGVALDEVFRGFQRLCLQEGADWVPYLAGAAGPGGYDDVISPATEQRLAPGDVLMLDAGLMWDGYFCDFNRNYAIGRPDPAVAEGHAALVEACAAAFAIARPGIPVSDLYHAMDRIVTGGRGSTDAGRLGHGLGMQLTEAPSLIPGEDRLLEPGMVLTLEPGIVLPSGKTLVHEEDIVIRADGSEWLTEPAGPQIIVL